MVRPIISRRGDTLIEVLFSITVFALIAVISINLMNSGVATAQATLEVTMARNEIDAQAEALRFIQNGYLAEKEHETANKRFTRIWEELTLDNAIDPDTNPYWAASSFNDMASCGDVYDTASDTYFIGNFNAFIINTRILFPRLSPTPPNNVAVNYQGFGNYDDLVDSMILSTSDPLNVNRFEATPLYPRIIYGGTGGLTNEGDLKEENLYRTIQRVQGVWVIAVQGERSTSVASLDQPEFYDFYIRTCWHAPGRRAPSTIGTIVRLYNPEVIE